MGVQGQTPLTASDAETLTIGELLELSGERDAFAALGLGYAPTWGTSELRAASATTDETVDPDRDVLPFAGAEEAMYWALQELVGPGDHAIVTLPNYQSMETLTLRTGAEVSGLPLVKRTVSGSAGAAAVDAICAASAGCSALGTTTPSL